MRHVTQSLFRGSGGWEVCVLEPVCVCSPVAEKVLEEQVVEVRVLWVLGGEHTHNRADQARQQYRSGKIRNLGHKAEGRSELPGK